jgi:opacity protein-like surface antigen
MKWQSSYQENICDIFNMKQKTGESMFNLFSKGCLSALALLCVMSSSVMAWQSYDTCCPSNRTYVGVFGGGIFSNSTQVSQMGTAYFPDLPAPGGPLAVFALGKAKSDSTGFGGAQFGYEWSQFGRIGCSNWSIAPAAEFEGFYTSTKRHGHLINQVNPQDRLDEHDFEDSFRTNMGVLLVNAVFSLNNSCSRWSPYVGLGIGATRIDLRKATSFQVSPPEPGVNHFNSRTSDSSWAFAAQVKAGIRYNICKSFHIFGEYRYLFVDASNYVLGSTFVSGHVPTSPWNIKVNTSSYNALVLGIQYDL